MTQQSVQISVTRSGADEFKVIAQSDRTILRAHVVTRAHAIAFIIGELDALEVCPVTWSPECLRTTEI